MKRIYYLIILLVIGSCNKPGCTDPDAVNYDSSANDEDGTCLYTPTLSTVPIIYDNQSLFAESGGIITSDGGSEITIRGLCWSLTPSPTVADDTTINGNGTGQFSGTINNLEFGSTYYVKAYATNSNGTGYGDELIFSTPGFTVIPDANFEQNLIALGLDDVLNGVVVTDSINSVDTLGLGGFGIQNFSGIEDFTS